MGMFDYVKYEMKCPDCGTTVNSFQSKDSACMMDELEFWEVNNFYDSCGGCGAWIEFTRKPKPLPIEEYEMTIERKPKKAEAKHEEK